MMNPLCALIFEGTSLLWPKQKDQGYLFDLGERKKWSKSDHNSMIIECCTWLEDFGIILSSDLISKEFDATFIREELPAPNLKSAPTPGVSRKLCALASLLNISSKTLANSLASWMQCERTDHRWLLSISRAFQGEPLSPGILYHRRSIAAFSQTLSRVRGNLQHKQLDVTDANALFSLIALWQRRRPTMKVRSNRAKGKPRRKTPKPLVELAGNLISQGQFLNLLAYAVEQELSSLAYLTIETALTEAHLAPHPSRKVTEEQQPNDSWLQLISKELARPKIELLLGEEYPFFMYRAKMMEAFQQGKPFPPPPDTIAKHPYVYLSYLINQYYLKEVPEDVFLPWLKEEDWEGKAMLLPQLKKRKRAIQ